MFNNLVAEIRKRMADKTTEELQRIYDERNEAEWSADAFEAIRQILTERGTPLTQHPISEASPSSPSRVADRALRRYRDAYLAARVTDGIGSIIKTVGFLGGALISIIGVVIGINSQNTLVVVGSIVAAAVFALPLWALGVLVSAQGQALKATLDAAVHTSPFLDDSQRAKAMSLE